MFFRTLEPQEYVLGRGFGGYFVPDDIPSLGSMAGGRAGVRPARSSTWAGSCPSSRAASCSTFVYFSGPILALVPRATRAARATGGGRLLRVAGAHAVPGPGGLVLHVRLLRSRHGRVLHGSSPVPGREPSQARSASPSSRRGEGTDERRDRRSLLVPLRHAPPRRASGTSRSASGSAALRSTSSAWHPRRRPTAARRPASRAGRASPTSTWLPPWPRWTAGATPTRASRACANRFVDKVRWFAGLYGATLAARRRLRGANRPGTVRPRARLRPQRASG